MTLTQKQTIANELRKYIAKTGASQTDLANRMYLRKEYLTHILKEGTDFKINAGGGKKVIIADKYFNRIAIFLGFSFEKNRWSIKPTPQLTSILANLQTARETGTTNIIIGDTGSGKTLAVNTFARKYPTDTFVITVSSTDNLNDLIDKVVDALKIPTGRTKSKKLRDIAKKLRGLKEDGYLPSIIFDESEYMKQPQLASMKGLHDYLDKYCAIILIGTEQLIDNINLLRRKNKQGMPQFYRRIKFGIRQVPAIDRTFKLFLKDLETDLNTKKFLRRICDNYGELHDVLVPVQREANKTGEPISENLIRKVLNLSNLMYA